MKKKREEKITRKVLMDVPIGEVAVNPRNPRRHPNIEHIKQSIEENGYIDPIIVDEKMMLLAGEGRYRTLLDMGESVVPMILQIEGLSQAQKERYTVQDNKSADDSMWDLGMLGEMFDVNTLKYFGFDYLREQTKEAKDKSELGTLPPAFDLNREQDFIVIYCEHDMDFTFLSEKFGLKKVVHPKRGKVGLSRLVRAKKVISLMKES